MLITKFSLIVLLCACLIVPSRKTTIIMGLFVIILNRVYHKKYISKLNYTVLAILSISFGIVDYIFLLSSDPILQYLKIGIVGIGVMYVIIFEIIYSKKVKV